MKSSCLVEFNYHIPSNRRSLLSFFFSVVLILIGIVFPTDSDAYREIGAIEKWSISAHMSDSYCSCHGHIDQYGSDDDCKWEYLNTIDGDVQPMLCILCVDKTTPGSLASVVSNHVSGCSNSAMYCSSSAVYREVQTFSAAHPDMTAWWYFTTTSGGTECKCMAYYVDTEGDAWEVTVGAYYTVNPLNNANCMTKTAFDARNNTDCAHAPDANDTCVSAQYGSPVATTEADECGAAAGDERGQTGCGN